MDILTYLINILFIFNFRKFSTLINNVTRYFFYVRHSHRAIKASFDLHRYPNNQFQVEVP